MNPLHSGHSCRTWAMIAWVVAWCCTLSQAQTFDSQSDGSDGALDYTGQSGTVVFDPVVLGIDPDGDNIYHFTTITIPSGLTLKLTAAECGPLPIHWLATGAVVISGTIDLDGANGHNYSITTPMPSIPGPGGFPGGIATASGPTSTAGFGPGGGPPGQEGANNNYGGRGGGHATAGGWSGSPIGGAAYGNNFLLPLIGGSGGGAGFSTSAGGGGAGGGAILIASSMSISISGPGWIRATGGTGGNGTGGGGGGAGGAIRLIAPVISGNGILSTYYGGGGVACCSQGGNLGGFGRIRLEAFQNTYTGSIGTDSTAQRRVVLSPNTIFLPTNVPRVFVTSVNGIPAPDRPRGSLSTPDLDIDASGNVAMEIEAEYVPLGTVVTLHIFSETEGLQTIQSSPLSGTLQLSTATASATFGHGASRVHVRATWTP